MRIVLRINSTEVREHILPSGQRKACTDLQWYLGGGQVEGQFGTALMMLDDEGKEVTPNPFAPKAGKPRQQRTVYGRDRSGARTAATIWE